MELIKVQASVASREPLPDFLVGLMPESLADLSWTDPSLGVQDCAWWPADDQSPVLGANQVYGVETLTIDTARKVVVVTRTVVDIPPPVPQSVTRRQGRQALLLAGYLNQVQPILDSMTDELQRGMTQIWWDDAETFDRNNPTTIQLGTMLGLDSVALDNLFIQASKL